eukprot:7007182-Prymnesium_polylepis.2
MNLRAIAERNTVIREENHESAGALRTRNCSSRHARRGWGCAASCNRARAASTKLDEPPLRFR